MPLTIDVNAFQLGLALGAASLASVGPTTLLIIREGFGGGRKLLVASTVWSVQIGLIAASCWCADAIQDTDARLRTIVLWLGLVFIGWFAFQSLRAAPRAGCLDHRAPVNETWRACLARTLGVICSNPMTYIERFLVPATIGQSLGSGRLLFAVGLVVVAGVGCYGYAWGGHAIQHLLHQRASLALFDRVAGVILSGVALSLGISLATTAL